MTVAIIPARGGSKGIPFKNLALVNEISLIRRAVTSALAAGCFESVFVSTDDPKIGDEARNSGATVMWRPDFLASDEASTESVLLHHFEADFSRMPPGFALIQCTSPFLRRASLQRGAELLHEGFNSVFSAHEDHSFRWSINADRSCKPVGHSRLVRPRRQDLEPTVVETGGFYFAETQKFLEERTRFCGTVGFVAVDKIEALEIDTLEDLAMARQLSAEWDRSSGKNTDQQR